MIVGASTGLDRPDQIAVDAGLVFSSNIDNNSLRVFRTLDDGNVEPQRVIVGPGTGLDTNFGLAVGRE